MFLSLVTKVSRGLYQIDWVFRWRSKQVNWIALQASGKLNSSRGAASHLGMSLHGTASCNRHWSAKAVICRLRQPNFARYFGTTQHANSSPRLELDAGVERRFCLPDLVSNSANSVSGWGAEHEPVFERWDRGIHLLRLARCHRVSHVRWPPRAHRGAGEQKLRWFAFGGRVENAGH